MAEWPNIAQLQRVLNIDPGYEDPMADVLAGLLEAAIAKVKADVGDWDEYVDVPDDSLSQAALRMGQLMALNPEVAASVVSTGRGGVRVEDPSYQRFLFGHRRRFGVA